MATCPACHTEVSPGLRWCPICHANVLNLSVGKLASPGKRLGAYVLDVVAPIAVLFFIFGIGGLGAAAGGQRAGGGIGCFLMSGLLLAYVIFALRLFARGTTPGKKLLGMYVVKEDGQRAGFGTMLFREWIGKVISGAVLLLGYLWILLDKDRQGWHDKLASTYVVEQQG
jgi:uncharacterized RDD family membrane protein YckC